MNADDQTRQAAASLEDPLRRSRRRLRALLRRALWRLAPTYAQRRAVDGELAGTVAHLQAQLDHVAKRHGEQIERLEDLARELVASVEALRRDAAER